MTNTTATPAASFRERIAARQAQFTAPAMAAAALAIGALTPSAAEAAIYTVASPSPSNVAFDPLDGSTASGGATTDNPIFLDACIGGRFVLLPALADSTNFSYFGADPEGFFGITPVTAGVTIDGTGIFHEAAQFEYAPAPSSYDDTTLHYVGFRYTNQGPGSDETYYGWAEFTVESEVAATLTRFALGSDGQAIVTGQDVGAIPEPSSAAALLGALALGATCGRRHRRR